MSRHPELLKIDEQVRNKYKEMYDSELKNPHGRHRSIDGELWCHPVTCAQFREICEKYRIELLEKFIEEHA